MKTVLPIPLFLFLSAILLNVDCPKAFNFAFTNPLIEHNNSSRESLVIKLDTAQKIKSITIVLKEEGDVTRELQAQLDKIPNGTAENPIYIKFPEGKFWTEGIQNPYFRNRTHVTKIQNKKHWIIDGYGTIFFTKAPSVAFGGSVQNGEYSYRRHFRIIDSENITVKGLRIEGSNYTEGKLLGTEGNTPDFWKSKSNDSEAWNGYAAYQSYWEFEHGFDILGSKNITLEDCEVFGVWGDGYYIGAHSQISDGVKIINSSVEWNGRQGLAVANSAQNILIDNLTVVKSRRSGIDLEPHSTNGFVRNVEIRNSNIECQLTPFAAGGSGDVSNIYIHHNKYSGSGHSLYVRASDADKGIIRHDWNFSFNERVNGRHRSSAPCIKMGWTSNVHIEGNIDFYQSKYYFGLMSGENVTIINNKLNGGNLVRLADVKNVKVRGNSPKLEILDNTEVLPQQELRFIKRN